MRYVRELGPRTEVAGVELVVAVISLDFDISRFWGELDQGPKFFVLSSLFLYLHVTYLFLRRPGMAFSLSQVRVGGPGIGPGLGFTTVLSQLSLSYQLKDPRQALGSADHAQ